MKKEGKAKISTQIFKINCIKSACVLFAAKMQSNQHVRKVNRTDMVEIVNMAKDLYKTTMQSNWIEAFRPMEEPPKQKRKRPEVG